MDELPLTGHALHNTEMEHHGKFGLTLGKIQHIAVMSRLDFFYATCSLYTKTVAPNFPGFQGIKLRVQYIANHPHKTHLYPSNYYSGSNLIRITWSRNQS